MKLLKCDICGIEEDLMKLVAAAERGKPSGFVEYSVGPSEVVDVCPGCASGFADLMKLPSELYVSFLDKAAKSFYEATREHINTMSARVKSRNVVVDIETRRP